MLEALVVAAEGYLHLKGLAAQLWAKPNGCNTRSFRYHHIDIAAELVASHEEHLSRQIFS